MTEHHTEKNGVPGVASKGTHDREPVTINGKLYCSKCGADCTREHVLCDRMEGQWCPGCFPWKRCKTKHGEGCSTRVFAT